MGSAKQDRDGSCFLWSTRKVHLRRRLTARPRNPGKDQHAWEAAVFACAHIGYCATQGWMASLFRA
eukprot:2892408-Amphidinium_carterae.1